MKLSFNNFVCPVYVNILAYAQKSNFMQENISAARFKKTSIDLCTWWFFVRNWTGHFFLRRLFAVYMQTNAVLPHVSRLS